MPGDPRTLKTILENRQDSYFSNRELAEMEKAHGAEVRAEVVSLFDHLTNFGMSPWGLDEAARQMHAAASEGYPWLAKESRNRLTHAFFANWK
jgi:hypothetical protein